jgi:HK97 family phage portal protein
MLDILCPRKPRAMDGWHHGSWFSQRARTQAGPLVDEDLALTYSALWCGTRLLAETEASLPLLTYKRETDGDRQQAPEHPLYDVIKSQPNPQMGSMAFREGRSCHQILWGQGFAEIERENNLDPDSPVTNLWPIHAGRVRPILPLDKLPDYQYWVYNNDGTRLPMKHWEILHVPGVLAEDGVWGKSVVAYGRESIGFGIGTERHGAKFFGSGAQPRGVVYGPGMKDPELRRTFRNEWKEIHGSPDSAEIAILPIESKYEKISMSNEDNQFLETRKFNVSEIARWLRVPAHMLGDLEKASYASLEVQSLEFVIYSLLPWLHRWEDQIELKCLSRVDRGRYFVEHLLTGLLRGDAVARMNAYRTAIMIGVMTINECRRLENMNGIGPAGDKHYVPMNMMTAEDMAAGLDAKAAGQGGAGPGSDQSGGKPIDAAAAFDRWTRRQLKRTQRQDLQADLGRMQARMPNLPSFSREAFRGVVLDVVGRMFVKEANAALRAVEARRDLDAWAEEFYAKQRVLAAEALTPACNLLKVLGLDARPESLAGRLAGESRQILLQSYNQESRDTLTRRLASWPTERASLTADRVLSGELS